MSRTRSCFDWQRLGAEAQGEDARAGNVAAISTNDLESVLAAHFDLDLTNPAICTDREAALAALVAGYRKGACSVNHEENDAVPAAFWSLLAEPARERLFAFMRFLDAEADGYFAKGREDANTIPVGAGLFDETIRGAARLEFVMALRDTVRFGNRWTHAEKSLDAAYLKASAALRLWVEKHNARRKDINWQRWSEFGQDELRYLVISAKREILGTGLDEGRSR